MPAPQHFITGAELDADRLDLLLHRAAALKETWVMPNNEPDWPVMERMSE